MSLDSSRGGESRGGGKLGTRLWGGGGRDTTGNMSLAGHKCGGEAEGYGKGILVYFSQLFCDLKKNVVSQFLFGKERTGGGSRLGS